jgi:predicted ribosomally synthesized peptide with SipW-like signal peptide
LEGGEKMIKKMFSKIIESKKLLALYGSLVIFSGLIAGVTYAAFSDKSNVLGATFTVGSADLKFLSDLTNEIDPTTYVDELPGPNFQNISPIWQKDFAIKLINQGSTNLAVTSSSNYTTANDPKDLRSDILVEIINWNDADKDGEVDSGEEGTSLGKKTIIKWKTEGLNLGNLDSGQIMPMILRFTAPTLADTQQGATGIFDFEFNSIQM